MQDIYVWDIKRKAHKGRQIDTSLLLFSVSLCNSI